MHRAQAGKSPTCVTSVLILSRAACKAARVEEWPQAAALAFQASAVPFVIAGVPIAREALHAEAELELAIGRNATPGVSDVGQIAGNVQDHAAKGKFSWRF